MKTFDEMWRDLSIYLKVEKALEQGFSNGKYTKVLAGYAKHVIGIDVSEDFFEIAKENLKDFNNIELMIMDATNTNFADKSFDVLLNTSFHEFDLSGDIYTVDLELKRRILKEMIRLSDTIVFVEPSEDAITNELFTVFNPAERHSDRIKQSNALIDEVMKQSGYELLEKGDTYNEDIFSSKEELEEEMLNWWADIKVPKDKNEKQEMIKQINEILARAGMLEELKVIENVQYRVFRKKKVS